MKAFLSVALGLLLLSSGPCLAHHGVASLGAAGLEGPGAPVETSTSATLPQGSVLTYLKLDYASFEKRTPERDDEGDYNSFWIFGLGYGLTSYLSAYLFVPYNSKVVEDSSFNTSGFADIFITLVLGFKYDEGFRLVPKDESLDDQEDWHFTVNGGLSLPTGDANTRDSEGNIDPGRSLGFGKPTFGAGFTATKTITDRFTLIGELAYLYFQEYGYTDGIRRQFGDEFRINTAATYRLLAFPESKMRLDVNLEANYLYLGRDDTRGVGEPATGGDILYLLPGLRGYWKNMSVGFGVKLPTLTNLNEQSRQQGAEGKENYRFIFTLSAIF